MSFLKLVDGIVTVTDEGMTLQSVQDLFNNDKHTTKKFFNDTALMGGVSFCVKNN